MTDFWSKYQRIVDLTYSVSSSRQVFGQGLSSLIGVSREEIDQMNAQYDAAMAEIATLEAEIQAA